MVAAAIALQPLLAVDWRRARISRLSAAWFEKVHSETVFAARLLPNGSGQEQSP